MFSNLCDAAKEDAKADNENGEAQDNNVDPKSEVPNPSRWQDPLWLPVAP